MQDELARSLAAQKQRLRPFLRIAPAPSVQPAEKSSQAVEFLSPRQREIGLLLYRTPATTKQILKASETFGQPFTDERYLQRFLSKMTKEGMIGRWPYHTAGPGILYYYKLTRRFYEQLRPGEDVPRSRQFFQQISTSLENHTHRLADVIVHTLVAADRYRVTVVDLQPENTVCLRLGNLEQKPDCTVKFRSRTGRESHVFFELDNGTEPLDSDHQHSIRTRILFHEQQQDTWLGAWKKYRWECPRPRYRLVFFAPNEERRDNILALAQSLARNPDRLLCYAVVTDEYLGEPDALRFPLFLDHHGTWQALVDNYPTSRFIRTDVRLPTMEPVAMF